MDDIHITRRDQYLRSSAFFSDGNRTHLIYTDDHFEAIVDVMPKGTVGCLFSLPFEDYEFNYILKGAMEIRGQDETELLRAGDTFSYYTLHRNYMFRILEDVETLALRNTPCYDCDNQSVEQLNQILNQLQEWDGDTLAHCERVKELTMGIAYHLRFDQTQLLNLFYAAKFHDVGKAKIPVEILLKPGRLTPEEYEVVKLHSRHTYEMIHTYYGEEVANIAFEHHERLDGKGYPRGLCGDQIGLPARIICVADAYDAMTVTRPYRQGISPETALAELRRWQDIQFDPSVIDALEQHLHSNGNL